ncbi:hypothetical protein Dda_9246 [Drechslerella dactyloides]|uniref:Uncharacterized protein n=1 Tax=Drechslerella dactyloides TaxID=74499 RepID=A0AAD6NF64_DREDA|nr:hypothetical protein Dda_9246 [Drechslerella dactyloides]
MFGLTKSTVAIAFALALFGAAAAAPTTAPVIDYTKLVIPGPGLPSIAELGLTNEDLSKPVPELEHLMARESENPNTLFKRYDPQCWGGPGCSRQEAEGCYNYLVKLGNTACKSHGVIEMCRAGKCSWQGRTLIGREVSSPCMDAANGGIWVLHNCRNIRGSNAAWGNGAFAVDLLGY